VSRTKFGHITQSDRGRVAIKGDMLPNQGIYCAKKGKRRAESQDPLKVPPGDVGPVRGCRAPKWLLAILPLIDH